MDFLNQHTNVYLKKKLHLYKNNPSHNYLNRNHLMDFLKEFTKDLDQIKPNYN